MATLRTYWKKRDFDKTAEPRGKAGGKAGSKKGFRYVIQKHDATRLHYDLRLELDGVMMSWAVTRGPSLVPGEKRLAIHVEDHPVEYNTFEGTIPEGQYGGGTVMVWDRGTWTPEHDPHKGMRKGHLDFELQGSKLNGHWHLVRMHKRPGERQEPWLLIKATDDFARKKSDPDILEEMADSAATGRTLEEIAADKKKVWHSNRSAKDQPKKEPKPARKPAKTAVKSRGSKKKPASVEGARKGRLPDFLEPSLATLSDRAPDRDGWVHEIKFDGYRIQARIGDGKVSLKTRTGLDWTGKFPAVEQACAALAGHDVILDGEIASIDESGVSNFSALQDDLKNGRHDRMTYYVFDLLHLDGQDLTGAPLVERKRALAALLAELPDNSVIRLSEHFEEDGPTMLKHACGLHLEGIVSKRADAPYRLRPQRRLAQDQVRQQPGAHRHRLRTLGQARPADPLAAARLLRERRPALRRTDRHRLGPEAGARPEKTDRCGRAEGFAAQDDPAGGTPPQRPMARSEGRGRGSISAAGPAGNWCARAR